MATRDPLRLPTRDIVRVLSIIFGFYILIRLVWVAHPVLFLFFLGVLFGLPLAQGADWLEKRRVPRAVGVAISRRTPPLTNQAFEGMASFTLIWRKVSDPISPKLTIMNANYNIGQYRRSFSLAPKQG